MSAASRGHERVGPVGAAFGDLWSQRLWSEAMTLATLVSHVRTLEGECFPEQLTGPKFEGLGIDPESLVAILAQFEAWGYLRIGPGRRFFVRPDFAAEIVEGRREELRESLRLVEGGKA